MNADSNASSVKILLIDDEANCILHGNPIVKRVLARVVS